MRKYGIDNFNIKQLIQCNDDNLDEQEIFFIQKY